MKKSEAVTIANNCIHYIENRKIQSVWNELLPILNSKTSFQMLDIIGRKMGGRILLQKENYLNFFDQLSKEKLMGGYVIIAQALIYLLPNDFNECFIRTKKYMIEGDQWYVCDIFGERVLVELTRGKEC